MLFNWQITPVPTGEQITLKTPRGEKRKLSANAGIKMKRRAVIMTCVHHTEYILPALPWNVKKKYSTRQGKQKFLFSALSVYRFGSTVVQFAVHSAECIVYSGEIVVTLYARCRHLARIIKFKFIELFQWWFVLRRYPLPGRRYWVRWVFPLHPKMLVRGCRGGVSPPVGGCGHPPLQCLDKMEFPGVCRVL